MTDTEKDRADRQQWQQISQRLDRVESELAIRNLVARYGMAVDCGDARTAASLHTQDCVYEVAAPGIGREDSARHKGASLLMEGRPAIVDMVAGAGHQALLPNCAHTVGPLQVQVDGNHASATGYSRLYHTDGESTRLMRLGFNRWTLAREAGNWRIAHRLSCPIGSDAAQELLRDSIVGWSTDW
jgi:ketosteroid isomerase-like protein